MRGQASRKVTVAVLLSGALERMPRCATQPKADEQGLTSSLSSYDGSRSLFSEAPLHSAAVLPLHLACERVTGAVRAGGPSLGPA